VRGPRDDARVNLRSFAALLAIAALSNACIIIPIPSGGGSSKKKAAGPLELRSECAQPVLLFVGDEPPPDATRTPLPPKGSTMIARRPDGTATVFVWDDEGEAIGAVTVPGKTQLIVIDKSCTLVQAK
jgi:hypothetical protein